MPAWRRRRGAKSCDGAGRRAAGASPPETTPTVARLKRRVAFVGASRGLRIVTPAFVLQVRARGDDDTIGVGFTASRKVGNAVDRNRARRRLKEVVRLYLATQGIKGCDHVLVARREALWRPFAELVTDLQDACSQARARLR